MSYRDTWAVCTKCGKKFIFRVEEQRQLALEGKEIVPPALCPDCRPARPSARRPQRPQRRAESRLDLAALGPGPYEGVIKWYDDEKGYGFIIHPGGHEIFFHRTGIAPGESPDFPDGTPVTYCLEQTEKGPQAVDVERMVA